MVHYSCAGFLAFVLCLVACLFASADGNNAQQQDSDVTIDQAQKAVEETKKSIKEVSDKAQDNIGNATVVLKLVKALKTKAEDAAAEAQKAPKDNEKATPIVEDIKHIFSQVSTFHLTAEKDLQNAIDSMNAVLKDTQTLNGECNIEITSNSDPPTNYKDAKNKALGIQAKAVLLNTNTSDALRVINVVRPTAVEMEQKAKDAQVKNLQVSGIIAGTELETMIREANSIIQRLNEKNEEVIGIVKEMQELKAKVTSRSPENIHELFQSTTGELSKATDVLKKVEQYKTDMATQKQKADSALTNVAKEKQAIKAQQELSTAKECGKQVKVIVAQLKSALETVTASVTNAKNSKQKLVEALSRITTREPSTEQTTATVKSNLPVGDGTEPHRKDTTKQTTISVPLLVALIASAVLQ